MAVPDEKSLDDLLKARPVDREKVDARKAEVLNEQRIRVYKRRPADPNPEGFRADRPWTVADIPEDSRKSCYPTWEDAMGWATLPSKVRAEIIEIEELLEGGW